MLNISQISLGRIGFNTAVAIYMRKHGNMIVANRKKKPYKMTWMGKDMLKNVEYIISEILALNKLPIEQLNGAICVDQNKIYWHNSPWEMSKGKEFISVIFKRKEKNNWHGPITKLWK